MEGTITETLKSTIYKKGFSTMRAFADAANIPYGTLVRIIASDDSFWRTKTETIYLICKTLGVTLESLINGQESEDLSLSEKEMRLVENYRKFCSMQAAVDKLLELP